MAESDEDAEAGVAALAAEEAALEGAEAVEAPVEEAPAEAGNPLKHTLFYWNKFNFKKL